MSGIKSALLVVMFFGAANADATPEQRERLRGVLGILKDPSRTAAEAYVDTVRATVEIMGPGWIPQGEWDDWITALLRDRA